MKNSIVKKFPVSIFKKLNIFEFNKLRYFSFKLKNNEKLSFFNLLDFIKVKKEEDFLIFQVDKVTKKRKHSFNNFCSSLEKIFFQDQKVFRKTLVLKGSGFSVSLSSCQQFLNFNLGYSHKILVKVPSPGFSVLCSKNIIVIESDNKIKLGDFANKIRNLRFPDPYKGKGFWYNNEVRELKEIKKV